MEDIRIGMLGYGEVGRIFAAGLQPAAGVAALAAWDCKLANPASADAVAMRSSATKAGVTLADSMAALCGQVTLLISAVTASNTLEVAQQAALYLRPGSVFLDLNSASPGTKKQAAAAIEAAGAHYVEAGVMTSVPPYGIAVPMLLGGARAEALAQTLRGWGMDAKPVAQEIGVASAIKMCRSIMIKGLEALVIESYATARHYGVEDQVLPTLAETFPQIDWPAQGAYFFSRVVQHGKRRAEEMQEAARTVREAGVAPLMASATADKQEWMAALAAQGLFADLAPNAPWQDYADRLVARFSPIETGVPVGQRAVADARKPTPCRLAARRAEHPQPLPIVSAKKLKGELVQLPTTDGGVGHNNSSPLHLKKGKTCLHLLRISASASG